MQRSHTISRIFSLTLMGAAAVAFMALALTQTASPFAG